MWNRFFKGSEKMKSKTKFLWLYTILLFSIALLLILFAGMTQQNYEQELENHETVAVGMQKSVTELTQINENLKAENAALRSELETYTSDSYREEAEKNQRSALLIKAVAMYNANNYKGARELLKDVDKKLLDEDQLAVYNKIMK